MAAPYDRRIGSWVPGMAPRAIPSGQNIGPWVPSQGSSMRGLPPGSTPPIAREGVGVGSEVVVGPPAIKPGPPLEPVTPPSPPVPPSSALSWLPGGWVTVAALGAVGLGAYYYLRGR